MDEKEFKEMMADPDVPLERKLWYVRGLLTAQDAQGLLTVLSGFLDGVEVLLRLVNPDVNISP